MTNLIKTLCYLTKLRHKLYLVEILADHPNAVGFSVKKGRVLVDFTCYLTLLFTIIT